MTYAITGAGGKLGRLVLSELAARVPLDRIVAISRTNAAAADLARAGYESRRGDYNDEESLDSALEGVERVLLIPGHALGARPAQHASVIAAAQRAGVGSIAYVSAPSADTTELVLAPDHKATEELLRRSGIPWVFLRTGWYTENYLPKLLAARDTGILTTSSPRGRVSSAPRSDFAAAAARVLSEEGHGGRIYELFGDQAWTFPELASTAARILRRDVQLVVQSPDEVRAELSAAGMPEPVIERRLALDRNIDDGLIGIENGALATLLGRPTTSLENALRAALAGVSQ